MYIDKTPINITTAISLVVFLRFFAGIQALCLNGIYIHLFCFLRFLIAP